MDNFSDNISDIPLIKLEEAISKNELKKYLKGENDYGFTNAWIEYPTDLAIVFGAGLNRYAKERNASLLNKKLHEALLELVNEPIDFWWLLVIIDSYYNGSNKDSLLFKLDIEPIVNAINSKIKTHKSALDNNREWLGARLPNGLLDHVNKLIERINDSIKRNKIIG